MGEGAGHEGDPDFVGGRIVGSGPNYLVDPDVVRVETRHPVLSVLRAVVGAREFGSSGLLEVNQGFLLRGDCLSPFDLLANLRTHRCSTREEEGRGFITVCLLSLFFFFLVSLSLLLL